MTALPRRLDRWLRPTLGFLARLFMWTGFSMVALPLDATELRAAEDALRELFARDADPDAPPDARLGTRATAKLTRSERRSWASVTEHLQQDRKAEDPANGLRP